MAWHLGTRSNSIKGSMIHKAGAGPEPIPHKEINVENLRDALRFAVSPPAKTAAKLLADRIRSEVSPLIHVRHFLIQTFTTQDGLRNGVDSFYRHLPLLNMRCDLDPSRLAVWWSTQYACISTSPCYSSDPLFQCMKLSAFAAQTLADAKQLDFSTLDLHRQT